MTCAEFQKVLPYIIETGGNAEQEQHLRSCPVCSDLVADLKYIAEQAKLLLPMHDPSPRVWEGIRAVLEKEGIARPVRGRLLGFLPGRPVPWALAAAAGLLLLFGIFFLSQRERAIPQSQTVATTAPAASAGDSDDQQLLSAVSEHNPSLRATYEENLKTVNASIADARQSVEQDPDDQDARESLTQAYEQKAMLYDMAIRSLN